MQKRGLGGQLFETEFAWNSTLGKKYRPLLAISKSGATYTYKKKEIETIFEHSQLSL